MTEITLTQFFWLTMGGLITGLSKFSVGGMGMLILPMIFIAVPDKEALAIIAFMYVITDIFAVLTYKKTPDSHSCRSSDLI